LRGQAPSLVWQPVHFKGGASLHCAQHHFPAYTTPVNGNGRHRANTASESASTTPTHRSHIHRMAVPPRVNPANRTYQCCAGHCCAGPKRHAYIYIHLDCFSALSESHCSVGWPGLRLSVVFPGIRAQNCGRYVKKRRSVGILAVYRGDDEELEHCGSRFRKKWR
jgi:hypothetical protein